MANVVQVKQLLNGERNLILAVYLKSDGSSGELVNQPLVTLAQANTKNRLVLECATYNFAGFDAVLQFASGGVNPTWKWVLSEGTNTPADFGPFGGLLDDSGMDGTGALTITTTGFTASQDQGSILLKMHKR